MVDLRMTRYAVFVVSISVLATGAGAYGEQGAAGKEPLTKEEFAKFLQEYQQFKADHAKMKAENEKLKSELTDVKAELSALREQSHPAMNEHWVEERMALIRELLKDADTRTESLLPGTNNLLITGFASATYQDRENSDSTFGAMIAPIILWKPNDRLFLESELHIMLLEDTTEVDLGYAHISYILNDYVTLGAGKFLLPFGIFPERLHPSWVNKLPTGPLAAGLVGESGLGFQIRGGAPIGPTKINYAAYIINGPDFGVQENDAGRLGWIRNRDNNNNRTAGGRIGFLPIPELEIGYSFLCGRVGDSGSDYTGVNTLMHGADFTYAREFDAIMGRFDLRGEFVWVNSDDVIFTGPFDPFTFDNNRHGWWVQAAYRPTKLDVKFGRIELRNFELIVRFDQLRQPGPGRLGIDRDQVTIGVDYWILPNAVVKAAYVIDDAHRQPDQNGFFLQVGVGF